MVSGEEIKVGWGWGLYLKEAIIGIYVISVDTYIAG
jgi:hypothetical protein